MALRDWVLGSPLAEQRVALPASAGWVQARLALTPGAGTTCGALSADTPSGPRSDLSTCSGRLEVTHSTAGATLDVDYVYLSTAA